MAHRHRTKKTTERPFMGCVNPKNCNPAAHGGVMLVRECSCGATKEVLVNGSHTESGDWVKVGVNYDTGEYESFPDVDDG